MLTAIRRFAVVAAALALLALAPLGIAAAEPAVECATVNPRTGACLLWVPAAGDSGPGDDDSVLPIDTTGGSATTPDPCSYQVANPQPPPSHPVWGGRGPVDGAVYLQVCPRPDGYGSGYRIDLVFVAAGTDPPTGPPIDPRVLAEQAVSSMTMHAPVIRMVPPPGSTSGLVGLPVWMWTERAAEVTGPIQQSASAGGVTVTAVGQLSHIAWDMGDGITVLCGAGTPYVPGAEGHSPDCGHVYAQASSRHIPGGGPWPITATSTWTVTWSGGGMSGTETLELSSSAELFVGELYLLNQDGGSR